MAGIMSNGVWVIFMRLVVTPLLTIEIFSYKNPRIAPNDCLLVFICHTVNLNLEERTALIKSGFFYLTVK